MESTYTINEHIHRFGLWTAARAASKSLLSNDEMKNLLQSINLQEEVESLKNKTRLTEVEYQQWLHIQCKALIKKFKLRHTFNAKTKRMSFGLAAKAISIYIKTVEVIPSKGTSHLSSIAYPPIDRILLKSFNKAHSVDLNIKWTEYDWTTYLKTIHALKASQQERPMWELETHWK